MNAASIQIARADINDAERTLDIEWGDGHVSRYPLNAVRGQCPCAACRTAREEARTNPFRVLGPNERAPSDEIRGVEPVGRYGMRITWADGHATGIYTFEYLRGLCPCDECRARAGSAEQVPYVHGIYIPK
jgi:DUF971 family protein